MNTADIVGMLDTSPEKLFYLVNPKFRFRTPKSAICPLILISQLLIPKDFQQSWPRYSVYPHHTPLVSLCGSGFRRLVPMRL